MSRLRRKVTTVRTRGAERRRNWDPSPLSAHYRVYIQWCRKHGKFTTQDSYCHYWRVVLSQVLLRWLVKPLCILLAVAVVCGIFTTAAMNLGITLGVLITITVLAYIVLGGWVAGQMLVLLDLGPDAWDSEWFSEKADTIKAGFVLLTLPVILVAAILLITLASLVSFLFGLEDDYKLYTKTVRWFGHAQLSKRKLLAWVRPWMIFPASVVVWSIVSGLFLGLLACVGTLMALVGIAYLADTHNQRTRRIASDCYNSATDIVVNIPVQPITPRAEKKRRLRRTKAVLVGIWDMFALCWSIILVLKWKICPIVKLPQ
ncbi:MAG TPA: hypothetical protein VLG92_02470 [Candidatus Saccharimonadia bacterium]|nr:hypothetical protein [Candidatus Saccharimonadia bacterium]